MSNCFNCVVDYTSSNASDNRIMRGSRYVYFYQGLETVVSVVEYPNRDSAHDNTHTNNYVTYRINGFHYKSFAFSDGYELNNNEMYIVFFKVKITNDSSINLTSLKRNGAFSDFILYKQPNDVIDYRYFKFHEHYANYKPYTREINIRCNKTFLVKPDEVFGVYYLVLSDDSNTKVFVKGNISVYFDVV